MNLQRYVSTVYCENVFDDDYLNSLDKEVKTIDSTQTYRDLRTVYTEKYSSYVNKDSPEIQYILDKLFFSVLFGKTIGNIFNTASHSVVLFPIFKDIDGSKRLNPSLRRIYRPILETINPREPFSINKNKNMYLFVPAFSDSDESIDEYESSLHSFFDRAFEFIVEQKQRQTIIGNRVQVKDTRFENIAYTVDKDGKFFTEYYNKKLNSEKSKVLDSLVRKFIEKLGCSLLPVKDPIDKLTKDECTRKFKADGYKKIELLNPFFKLLESFLDYYKKTNNREYFKLSSSTENQSIFRIYYRVNNTDYKDTYDKIKTGSNFVYSISDPFKVGYFIKKEGTGSSNKYIFREYSGLTSKLKSAENLTLESIEEQEEIDRRDVTIPKEFAIEVKPGTLNYRRITAEGDEPFTGIVTPIMNLHIYEKYKWFQFKDLSGDLSTETKIKFYKNIRFDKQSLIDFLVSKQKYDPKIHIGIEFLKLNQNTASLLEYVEFITNTKKNTHVYDVNDKKWFRGSKESFIEGTKKAITDMLFETNKVIYTSSGRVGKLKEDTTNNYKMGSYTYYPIKNKTDVDKHLNRVVIEDKEIKYCKKGKCSDLESEISVPSPNIMYAIVIVDITKEEIESITDLKKRVECKKLSKKIISQLQPILKKLPKFGGKITKTKTKKKKRIRFDLRSRRRKNRH